MEERPQGTPPSSDPDGGDPHPCPEDDEFFGIPDAESQEEAINRFMEGLEQQECSGFSQIDRLISSLPVPVLKKSRCMSHVQALEGGFCSFISLTFCSPYPQRPCGGRRLDNLWMCGMGVRFVQGHDACQMLSL